MRIALLIMALVALVVGTGCESILGTPTPVSNELAAWDVCQTFVKRELKAPSTAKFPRWGSNEYEIAPLAPAGFRILSYVDAQNSFGAQIRTRFECKTRLLEGTTWESLSVSLFE